VSVGRPLAAVLRIFSRCRKSFHRWTLVRAPEKSVEKTEKTRDMHRSAVTNDTEARKRDVLLYLLAGQVSMVRMFQDDACAYPERRCRAYFWKIGVDRTARGGGTMGVNRGKTLLAVCGFL